MFKGEFKDDVLNGRVTLSWSPGDVYDGEWKGGERCGEGKMSYYSLKYVETRMVTTKSTKANGNTI